MGFFLGLIIGLTTGWVVFKRPQWATDLIAKIRARIGL